MDILERRVLRVVAALVLCLLPVGMYAQDTPLPYYCTFESAADTVGWRLVSPGASAPSEWYWGSAIGRGSARSLYVSADGGATAGYAEATGYYIAAYRKFTLQPNVKYDLAFDCRVGGEKAIDGKVNDGMMVVWLPASQGEPTSGFGGAQFPVYAQRNVIRSTDGRTDYANNGWMNVTCVVDAFESEYYLAFVWKANGSVVKGLGACIDNVQIAPQRKGECAERPWNLKSQSNGDNSGFTFTWEGRADEYELMYYRTDAVGTTTIFEDTHLTSKSYSISLANAPEGVYSVLVRSVCGADTSAWSELSNVFLYDANAHCVDYINLESEDVLCASGVFVDPGRTVGVVDHGYESKESIHTVHFIQDEYDPRTNYQLKTVPEGYVASVRISNWKEAPAGSASITYKYHVTDESDVLKVQYAAVLQYASHHPPKDQTRIIVEIFDAATDTLLSQCTRSEFNAKDVNEDAVRGWHEFAVADQPAGLMEIPLPIMWCDWSVIGINLEPYIGMDLKIRYTLKACAADTHFAYAYFTLDCDDGEVDGISCGEHPEVFRVPKGFLYRWYELKNPGVTVGTADTLAIDPNDTATYAVDCIFPENDSCYFTLKASALPRKPIAGIDYEIERRGCENIVKFRAASSVIGLWDTDGDGDTDTIQTGDPCLAHLWKFDGYGVATDFEPILTVPARGDTFDVYLTSAIDKNMECIDSKVFRIEVPSIEPDTTFIHYGICNGSKVTHDGKDYDKPGRFELPYQTLYGCDSIVVLDISMMIADTIPDADTVCTDELPVLFHGEELTETGHYEHVVKSLFGCDSVVYTMDLLVNTSLVLTLASDGVEACADADGYTVGYNIMEGVPTDYSLSFSDAAKAEGFTDVARQPLEDTDAPLTFPLPDSVLPGRYSAELIFYNSDCGDLRLPLTVDIFYPSDVIVQRWNDVFGLRNRDYNGGYDFTAYQWYKDGSPIDGATSPTLYAPEGLDTTADYTMLLTRLSDAVTPFTCPVRPQLYSDMGIEVYPTVVFSGQTVAVSSAAPARASLYSVDGARLMEWELLPGMNSLPMPLSDGIYLLMIQFADGTSLTEKIIVRR